MSWTRCHDVMHQILLDAGGARRGPSLWSARLFPITVSEAIKWYEKGMTRAMLSPTTAQNRGQARRGRLHNPYLSGVHYRWMAKRPCISRPPSCGSSGNESFSRA
jgi:hypothetical protein